MYFKNVAFLFLIIVFISLKEIHNHRCGADELKIKPKSIKLKINNKRNLAKSNTYRPILIGFDFSNFKKPESMDESAFSDLKSIIKETGEEFSKLIQIIHEEIDLSENKDDILDSCLLDSIGNDYKNFLIKNDLIIFPMISSKLGTFNVAAAKSCMLHPDTNRPIGGVLYLNPRISTWKKNWKLDIKYTIFHEITHVLGFNYDVFSNLKMVTFDSTLYYINSPKVLEKAKEYFGCDNLPVPGVPLENQGGTGSAKSHWEGRYMFGEYMNMEMLPEQAISDITLALLEDTGFYKVNYFTGGLFKFGKNKGCDFLSKKCIENDKATFDEFCDVPNEPKCTASRTSKSKCDLNTFISRNPYHYFSNDHLLGIYFADYCPVAYLSDNTEDNYPYHCQFGTSNLSQEYGEIIGKESLCFLSSLLPDNSPKNESSKIPICYGVKCDSTKKQIIVKIGEKNVVCPQQGGEIENPSGFKGILECPKYEDICSPNDDFVCNEIFSCLDEEVKKNNYNYKTDYYDYEGPASTFKNDDEKDDDENANKNKDNNNDGIDEDVNKNKDNNNDGDDEDANKNKDNNNDGNNDGDNEDVNKNKDNNNDGNDEDANKNKDNNNNNGDNEDENKNKDNNNNDDNEDANKKKDNNNDGEDDEEGDNEIGIIRANNSYKISIDLLVCLIILILEI